MRDTIKKPWLQSLDTNSYPQITEIPDCPNGEWQQLLHDIIMGDFAL
jgi:hypothetical protein